MHAIATADGDDEFMLTCKNLAKKITVMLTELCLGTEKHKTRKEGISDLVSVTIG